MFMIKHLKEFFGILKRLSARGIYWCLRSEEKNEYKIVKTNQQTLVI